jgi:hypothetical protein
MAAEDAALFFAHAQAADAGPDAVTLLFNELRRIAGAFRAEGGPAVLADLAAAQRFGFRCLDGPADPGQSRDLYFLTGVACGLLAHAGMDLGQADAAMTQARTALLCAERAVHPGLRVWVRNEQCTIARWAGWHHESLRFALLAAVDAGSVRGTAVVGRALREARAQAAIGDAERARGALATAAEARDRVESDELDEIGGWVALTPSDDLFLTADTLSMLPDHTAAERGATQAVAAFADEVTFGNKFCAHTDLALARAQQADVDGAREALRPVLDLPPQRRVHPVLSGLQRVYVALTGDPGYHGSPAARDTAAEIEVFSQLPARTGLPE